MSKVRGKNVLLLFYDIASSTYMNYACALSCSLNINTDILETSEVGAGNWATFRAIKQSFEGSLSGIMNLYKANNLSLYDLREKQFAFQKMKIKFQHTDESGNIYNVEGNFFISKSSSEGPDGSLATFSIDLKGTGSLIETMLQAKVPGARIFDNSFDNSFN